MKARGCTNRRPQQEYITKEESSLPTVSLYALLGPCSMDAMDERKVMTVYIPGEFLQGTGHKMNTLGTSCSKESWWT